MAIHKSFKTSERLAPLAIISRVRFSAANRDSACDGVVAFGPCLDADPAGCTALAAALKYTSWSDLRFDSGELFISIGHPDLEAHHAGATTTALISAACVFLSYPPAGRDERPIPRRFDTTTL